MESYVMDIPSYKKDMIKNVKKVTPTLDVIEKTYTEIEW